jgi:Flp pilus assembly protein TadD
MPRSVSFLAAQPGGFDNRSPLRKAGTSALLLSLAVFLLAAPIHAQSSRTFQLQDLPSGASSPETLDPAFRLLKEERFQEAEAAARKYLQNHLVSAPAHFLLGLILFREAKAKESLAEYTDGAKYETPSANDLKVVGLDYVLLDDYDDANKWLAKSTELDPADAIAWYSLGRVQYNLNRFGEAIQSFQKTLDIDHRNVKAEDNMGLSLAALNRSDEAIAAYRQAIAWQQDSPHPSEQPFLNLGTLFIEQNQLVEATRLLLRAEEIAPRNPKVHEQLGHAYLLQNDLAPAADHLEKAVALSPEDSRLHFKLGQVYRKLGETEKAKREFARTEALNGTRSTAH